MNSLLSSLKISTWRYSQFDRRVATAIQSPLCDAAGVKACTPGGVMRTGSLAPKNETTCTMSKGSHLHHVCQNQWWTSINTKLLNIRCKCVETMWATVNSCSKSADVFHTIDDNIRSKNCKTIQHWTQSCSLSRWAILLSQLCSTLFRESDLKDAPPAIISLAMEEDSWLISPTRPTTILGNQTPTRTINSTQHIQIKTQCFNLRMPTFPFSWCNHHQLTYKATLSHWEHQIGKPKCNSVMRKTKAFSQHSKILLFRTQKLPFQKYYKKDCQQKQQRWWCQKRKKDRTGWQLKRVDKICLGTYDDTEWNISLHFSQLERAWIPMRLQSFLTSSRFPEKDGNAKGRDQELTWWGDCRAEVCHPWWSNSPGDSSLEIYAVDCIPAISSSTRWFLRRDINQSASGDGWSVLESWSNSPKHSVRHHNIVLRSNVGAMVAPIEADMDLRTSIIFWHVC